MHRSCQLSSFQKSAKQVEELINKWSIQQQIFGDSVPNFPAIHKQWCFMRRSSPIHQYGCCWFWLFSHHSQHEPVSVDLMGSGTDESTASNSSGPFARNNCRVPSVNQKAFARKIRNNLSQSWARHWPCVDNYTFLHPVVHKYLSRVISQCWVMWLIDLGW